MFTSPSGRATQSPTTPLLDAQRALAQARAEGDPIAEVIAHCRIDRARRAAGDTTEIWWTGA